MLNIYAASSWRNERYLTIVNELIFAGHNVYNFREPPGGHTLQNWEQVAPGVKHWNTTTQHNALMHPNAINAFECDKAGMDGSDVCVLIMPCGRSAHLEAGYMAGQGKFVIALLEDGEEPELMLNLLNGRAVNVDSLLKQLKSYESVKEAHQQHQRKLRVDEMMQKASEPATVADFMRHAADIFEQRAAIYGDNYKNSFGKVMSALFEDGATFRTQDDWNRLGVFVQMVSKLTRYSGQFFNGGHSDSLTDLSVYSNMLLEVDKEIQELARICHEVVK